MPAIVYEAGHPVRLYKPRLALRSNIGEMARKAQVKCTIAGCYRRLKLTLAECEELRRVGREHNATAGLVCPAHVKAAFNFEFDDIDIDVPMGEFLVEASKLGFTQFKRRKRGNPQVGGIEWRGVPACRGQRPTVRNPLTPATDGVALVPGQARY